MPSPSIPTSGVRSEVRLSAGSAPVSEAVRRSGVPGGLFGTVTGTVVAVGFPPFGTVVVDFGREDPPFLPPVSVVPVMFAVPSNGLDVSILRSRGCAVVAVLPRVSEAVAVTDHIPSVSSGSTHPMVSGAATNVHVLVTPPLVAVITTVAPASTPGTSMDGVESAVTSSVDEVPVSDDAERSGLAGRTGAVASTVRFVNGPTADVLPAGSVRVPDTDHVPSVRAGRSQDVADPTT